MVILVFLVSKAGFKVNDQLVEYATRVSASGPDLSRNDLAMAKTTGQPDLVNRFKELWINELMPTFKKDLLTKLKTEIGKQMKSVAEQFESKIRDLDKKLNSLETSQSFVSSKFDAFTAGLANTKRDMKSLNDKVNQLEDSMSHFENDLYDNMASLDATQQYLRGDCLEITGIPVIPLDNPTRLVTELSSALDVVLNKINASEVFFFFCKKTRALFTILSNP